MFKIYQTRGCSYNKCVMCNYTSKCDIKITDKDIQEQHDRFLIDLDKELDSTYEVLIPGSFLNENEISLHVREYILTTLQKRQYLKKVFIESRPEYITQAKIQNIKNLLKGIDLELAMGYETSNEYIRNKVLNKNIFENDLDAVLNICAETGTNFCSYILVKPPNLSENEAKIDAIDSAIHVINKAKKLNVRCRIAFQPIFITGTYLEKAYLDGFRHPSLWSVVDIILETRRQNPNARLTVALSDEGLSKGRQAMGCIRCDRMVRQALDMFNEQQDLKLISKITCPCRETT